MWSICRSFNKEEPAGRKMRRNVGCGAEATRRPQSNKQWRAFLQYFDILQSTVETTASCSMKYFINSQNCLSSEQNLTSPESVAVAANSAPLRRQESPEDRSYRCEELVNAALVCHSSRTRSVTLRNADCSGGSGGPGCLETTRKQEITSIRPRSEEEVRSERMELL